VFRATFTEIIKFLASQLIRRKIGRRWKSVNAWDKTVQISGTLEQERIYRMARKIQNG